MASPITWADVLALPSATAAKFSSVTAPMQTAILNYVNTLVGLPSVFDGEGGPTTRLARMYLAGHMGVSLPPFGIVASEAAGGLSRSYAVPPPQLDELQLTVYGRMYSGLVNRSFARLPIVG